MFELPSDLVSVFAWRDWLNDDPVLRLPSYNKLSWGNSSISFLEWHERVKPAFELPFEKPFPQPDPGPIATMWYRDQMGLGFAICAFYLIAVFTVQKIMQSRNAFDLRPMWMTWNLFLAAFSACGALRMVPHLIKMLILLDFKETVCGDAERFGFNGASGLWTFLFIFSKVPELLDTFFIVLSKRPLILLQWYHHVTVLLYCWHAFATRAGSGIWFIAMNYTVHAVMYFYFAMMQRASLARATAKRLPANTRQQALLKVERQWGRLTCLAPLVTIMQLVQMGVGMAILYAAFRYKRDGVEEECSITRMNWLAGFAMYASYFALFFVFFVKRYCCKRAAKELKGLPTSNKKTD